MMLNFHNLKELLSLAGVAAKQAGHYIADFDRTKIEVNKKEEGFSEASAVVTQVDLHCEHLIEKVLAPSCQAFDLAFLGEESASEYPDDQHPRFIKPYYWCVDPLDGTLPFTENVPGYSVSIALVSRSGEALLGVVYDPVTQNLYQGMVVGEASSISGLLLKNGSPWEPKHHPHQQGQRLSLFVDRSFPRSSAFEHVIGVIREGAKSIGFRDIDVKYQGGSVMNAIEVLEHRPACYVKLPKATPGGGSLWDVAATAAIAKAGNCWVSDIWGKPLNLNGPETLFMHKYGAIYTSDKAIADMVMTLYSLQQLTPERT